MDGLQCTDTGKCPVGQTCDMETNTCYVTPPPAAKIEYISAGVRHTCGIDPQNGLWCWGDNTFGELGVGDADPRLTPTHVSDMASNGWNKVSAGEDATCGIGFAGDLFCWGSGDVVGTQSNTPREITDPAKWLWVSVGRRGFCAVASDNSTWCNWDGTLKMVADGTYHATRVAASAGRQCILNEDANQLYCWGVNDHGQALKGAGDPAADPVPIAGNWISIAAGPDDTCALDSQDHLWCWGDCENYQTGTAPGSQPYCAPTKVDDEAYIRVAVGDDSVCATNAAHQATCFGLNHWGQLGRATIEPWALPGEANSAADFNDMSVGATHVCATSSKAEAFCWGSNGYGQLGTDEVAFVQAPAQVGQGTTWLSVSAGLDSTCAIASDHTMWCWGTNSAGQLADGTTSPSNAPLQVGLDADWYEVSVGSSHICALKGPPMTGTIWCWGSNGAGQLGRNPADVVEREPRQVGTASDWNEIQAGNQVSCAIRDNDTLEGGVYCWGDGDEVPKSGENGTPGYLNLSASASWYARPQDMYVRNEGLSLFVVPSLPNPPQSETYYTVTVNLEQVARGESHHCGITSGQLWCWGYNASGQLGADPNGATGDNSLTSVRVGTASDWTSVDVGGHSTCGIRSGGILYCWGDARTIGTPIPTTYTSVPTPLTETWKSVSVGNHHVCAIKTDDTLWCWGDNAMGELGSGATGSGRPMRVKPGM